MTTSLQVVWTIFIGFSIGVFRHQFAAAEGTNSSEHGKLSTKPLIFTWIAKPPYIEPPTNGSSGSEERGMFNDAVTRYIIVECGLLHPVPIKYELGVIGARSEFEMIELLRQNKAQVALPIFEHIINRQYGEFPFFKVVDYPGTEYITIDDNSSALTVVLDAVFKAWPLLAVTIVLTAIAGIIMWALDTYWNSEEFPRSFIKGSWDGFWWSFISMTTVGYGDKSPKSIVARIFSIIWIMLGLITMAIFTANITSALTAASLELTPNSLDGLKVGVLHNGTEYEHALLEGASPTEYATIEEMIQELHSKQIDGVLLDHYAASYYQARDKLKSLIMVTKFEFSRDVGLLFSKDRQELAGCLNFHRSNIWRLAQTITSTYKLNKQKTSKKFNLFGDSNHFVKQLLYISLGVLGGLLLIGIVWDTFCRKKDQKIKEELELGVVNGGLSTERQTIHSDMKVARTLLKQMETHLHRLEAKVSRIDFKR